MRIFAFTPIQKLVQWTLTILLRMNNEILACFDCEQFSLCERNEIPKGMARNSLKYNIWMI